MKITLLAVLAMAMVVAPAFASGDLVLSKEFTIRGAVDGANFAPTTHGGHPGSSLHRLREAGTNLQTFTSRGFLATTSGAKTLSRQGRVASLLPWVVNGVPRVVANGPIPNAVASVNLAPNRLTKAEISSIPYLSAFLPSGGLGSGTIQITGAALNVTYVR